MTLFKPLSMTLQTSPGELMISHIQVLNPEGSQLQELLKNLSDSLVDKGESTSVPSFQADEENEVKTAIAVPIHPKCPAVSTSLGKR